MSHATTATIAGPTEGGRFAHVALLYRSRADYRAGVIPFVQAALAAREPVLIAAPPANLDPVRDALGDGDARVSYVDMTDAGRNPGRILPAVLLSFANDHPGRRVSIIGEPVWPGRTRVEYPACVTHEALINAAFAGRDATILCPYDTTGLGPEAIRDAHRTHPMLVENGTQWPSSAYRNPFDTADSFNEPLPAPPAGATTLAYRDQRDQLAPVRRFVTEHASRAGLSDDAAAGLAVAVNELATNTIEHTTGGGQVTIWTEPQTLVCQVEDTGNLADPLAGRIPVTPDQLRGRGLMLVNLLCDLVRVHRQPDRTITRLYTHR